MNILATDFTSLSPQSKLNISSPFSNPQNQSSTAKQPEAENNDETRVQGARKWTRKEPGYDGDDIVVDIIDMVIIVVVITMKLAFNVAENGWEKILMMVAMIFCWWQGN